MDLVDMVLARIWSPIHDLCRQSFVMIGPSTNKAPNPFQCSLLIKNFIMGQCYVLCNLDKRERMSLRLALFGTMFFSGQKLCEQLHNLGVKPLLALALVDFTAVTDNPNSLGAPGAGIGLY
jgi:hypothetical protein